MLSEKTKLNFATTSKSNYPPKFISIVGVVLLLAWFTVAYLNYLNASIVVVVLATTVGLVYLVIGLISKDKVLVNQLYGDPNQNSERFFAPKVTFAFMLFLGPLLSHFTRNIEIISNNYEAKFIFTTGFCYVTASMYSYLIQLFHEKSSK